MRYGTRDTVPFMRRSIGRQSLLLCGLRLAGALDRLGLALIRVQNGDDLLASAMVFVGVEHHGRVAQGPQIPRYLGDGPAAQLGLGRDGLLDLGVRDRAGGESRINDNESAERGERSQNEDIDPRRD